MIRQTVVFPFNEALVPRLAGLAVVPRVNTLTNFQEVLNPLYMAGTNPRCFIAESSTPLTSVELSEGLSGVPIALNVPSLGPLTELFCLLPVLRMLNLRIYLPAGGKGNLTGLRILSSLGIETAVLFSGEEPDWDRLADLMTYALFKQVPNAPIAPFGYLYDNFDPRGRNDFGAVYFEDPRSYLHMDKNGRVALSGFDLEQGRFIAESIEDIMDGVEELEPYKVRLEEWREHFLDFDQCSTCPGWRVCSGTFGRVRQPDDHCRGFFSELLDSLEQSHLMKREPLTVWRP